MTIICIDVSAGKNTGWAVIRTDGTTARLLGSGTHVSTEDPLLDARQWVLYLVGAYCGTRTSKEKAASPDLLIMERNIGWGNPVVRETLGLIGGAILVTAREEGLRTTTPTVSEMKAKVCGKGNADKKQVQAAVEGIFGVKPETEHQGDALGYAAHWCIENGIEIGSSTNKTEE